MLDDLEASAGNRRAASVHAVPLTVVVAGFAVSRIAYYLAGVRFDAEPLGRFWQFIDPELLRDRLFESLLYLHAQPPLFNLYLGAVLKLFPGQTSAAFAMSSLALGVTLAVALYLLMAWLGVDRRLAAGLTLLFVVGPATVLYENWLFYTYPVTVLLCLAAATLAAWVRDDRAACVYAFFAILGAIVLLRGSFHPMWYAAIWLAAMVLRPRHRRLVLVAGMIPFVIVLSWPVKNLALLGTPGGTWVGMNLARTTTFLVPRAERERLVTEGSLSPHALVAPFSSPESYGAASAGSAPRGVALLDRDLKSGGAVNFHHMRYVEIGRSYLADALYVLRTRPETFAAGLSLSWVIAFLPASDSAFLLDNRSRIRLVDTLHSRLIGQIIYAPKSSVEAIPRQAPARRLLGVAWLLVLGYGIAVVYGTRRAWTGLRGPDRDVAVGLVSAFLVWNVVYVLVIGNALELGENNRFRFVVDPLCLALLGMFIDDRIRRRRGGGGAAP